MNEQYVHDVKIINEELMKCFEKLAEQKVSDFSIAMFLAHFLHEFISEFDDKNQKEAIIKRFMDD